MSLAAWEIYKKCSINVIHCGMQNNQCDSIGVQSGSEVVTMTAHYPECWIPHFDNRETDASFQFD